MEQPTHSVFPIIFSNLHHYFHDKYSDKGHPLVSPFLTFAAGTHHATYTRVNPPHSLYIPLISQFHSDNSFPRTAALWNHLSRKCVHLVWFLNIGSTLCTEKKTGVIQLSQSQTHADYWLIPAQYRSYANSQHALL